MHIDGSLFNDHFLHQVDHFYLIKLNWEEENLEYLRWSKNSFTAKCLREADEKKKNVLEAHDYEAVKHYWTTSFAGLADKTRTSVIATFTGLADTLSHGLAWQLFGTETNIVPEMAYDGAIFIIDLSIQNFNETGKLCQGIFKLMFQRALLRREVNDRTRVCFIWADESQHFVSSTDYLFLSTSRSQKACMVYLTQNISNYYSVLGSHGRDQANALLGNFQTKIFHSNGDSYTNQFASETIGQHWITTNGFNTSTTDNGSSRGASGQQTLSYKVLPSEFTTLKKGGPANNLEIEAVIFQGGRIFKASGDTYMKVVFRQERKP